LGTLMALIRLPVAEQLYSTVFFEEKQKVALHFVSLQRKRPIFKHAENQQSAAPYGCVPFVVFYCVKVLGRTSLL